MKKGTKIEFNDGRMDDLRKEGTFSRIYLVLPDNVLRIHTVIIEGGSEFHRYINVNCDEIHEI
ncbi:MAG: hypothetical protein SLAVMIC_00378 [uncultured marine phage]|uniref:Uncharacterized protein n=1 Tax=uncultured marine phage TaxID=707152 RepID=A0A8D9C8U1_9VIRU|nr:MAG: hypothetical protein SLAVMIC_00378 [uncultured marine phage]